MPERARTARPRHFLMCRPTYFDVHYSINPWMDPRRPTATDVGVAQWKWLHDVFVELGHRVDLVQPVPGMPDMVFTANGAIVVAGRAMVARFRHDVRTGEEASILEWFRAHGYADVVQASEINEGEGDVLLAGDRFLAGTGFRSAKGAQAEVAEFFGVPAQGLTLVDPRFYHLDTALAVVDVDTVMYHPPAFSAESREVLADLYPDAILASVADAEVFGLNAVSDGHHVVLPEAASRLHGQLAERGFEPIGVDMTELLKAGGSVKCCTLELRGAPGST